MMAAESRAGIPLLGALLPELRLAHQLAALPVGGLQLDSRALRPGDVFVALPGVHTDGRAFIAQAVASGAIAIVAEAEGWIPVAAAIPVIPVAGLASQLSAIAGRYYADPSSQVAVTGVTGTNGKTTVSQLLARLIALLGTPAGVVGTLGWGLVGGERPDLTDTGMTTPDAIRAQAILASLRDQGAQRVAMEVSSHSLAQHRVSALHFDTAIFTNLSRDHLDYHGDMASYREAKSALFRRPGLRTAVINADDSVAAELIAGLAPHIRVYRYALSDPSADLYTCDLNVSARGFSAEVCTPWGTGALHSPLIGRFNVGNVLAIIAACCSQGYALADVLAAVPALPAVRGRMEVVTAEAAPVIVVDYAHTPDALDQVLRTLRDSTEGRLWCVFGCGGDRDHGKRPLMGQIASALADRVIITSDNPRSEDPSAIIAAIVAGIPPAGASAAHTDVAVETMVDRRAAIHLAIQSAAAEDTVLIAGKGHEDYQLVAGQRWPFSDVAEARLALRARGGRNP